jgi:hypothetical protein
MIPPLSPAIRPVLPGNAVHGADEPAPQTMSPAMDSYAGPADGLAQLTDRPPAHQGHSQHRSKRMRGTAESFHIARDRTAGLLQSP